MAFINNSTIILFLNMPAVKEISQFAIQIWENLQKKMQIYASFYCCYVDIGNLFIKLSRRWNQLSGDNLSVRKKNYQLSDVKAHWKSNSRP